MKTSIKRYAGAAIMLLMSGPRRWRSNSSKCKPMKVP